MSYTDVLRRYDSPETLFYLDPPYWDCEDDYGAGFAKADFETLAEQLAAIAGRFILSINDTPAIRTIFAGFAMDEVETTYTLSTAMMGAGKRVGELVITGR